MTGYSRSRSEVQTHWHERTVSDPPLPALLMQSAAMYLRCSGAHVLKTEESEGMMVVVEGQKNQRKSGKSLRSPIGNRPGPLEHQNSEVMGF